MRVQGLHSRGLGVTNRTDHVTFPPLCSHFNGVWLWAKYWYASTAGGAGKRACNYSHVPWEGTQGLPECRSGRDFMDYVVKPLNEYREAEPDGVRSPKLKKNILASLL